MFRFPVAILVAAFFTFQVSAQLPDGLLKDLQKIKLLESTREDVKQILYAYTPSGDDRHRQTFFNDQVEIELRYANGSCSDDEEEDDPREIWKVGEWKVTRIAITPNEAVEAKAIGFNLSKLMKEQMYKEYPDRHIYHDKSLGLAVEVSEDGVEKITFFPRQSASKKLCKENVEVKEFYARQSWFANKLEDRHAESEGGPANVEELTLDPTELSASSARTIAVTTVAVDPENDVLTYKYVISGGTIKGSGAKVVWDLTGVPPGTYTITAGVDDGCGICGKTVTKTVVVK